MAGKKEITISDIAKLSGVSNASVSRVLNHKGIVSPATYEKILRTLHELNYPFDEYAAPEPGECGVILLNIPSLENPFYNDITNGVRASASAHGFQLLVNVDHVNEASVQQLIRLVKRVKPLGIIVTNNAPAPLLRRLNENLPVVQCCEYDAESNLPYVSVDDFAAAQKAVNYLISTGHRKIAFVNGPSYYKYAKERLRGYLSALEQAGLPCNESWIVQSSAIKFDMALSSVTQLLNLPERPDAFFTVSDVYAAAVVRAAQQLGLNVPREVAVVGFDNLDIAKMTNPAITTINQPKFQLGFTACEMLLDRIDNPESPLQHVLLDTELIVRQSTAF